MTKHELVVQWKNIRYTTVNGMDYVCMTDIAKLRDTEETTLVISPLAQSEPVAENKEQEPDLFEFFGESVDPTTESEGRSHCTGENHE